MKKEIKSSYLWLIDVVFFSLLVLFFFLFTLIEYITNIHEIPVLVASIILGVVFLTGLFLSLLTVIKAPKIKVIIEENQVTFFKGSWKSQIKKVRREDISQAFMYHAPSSYGTSGWIFGVVDKANQTTCLDLLKLKSSDREDIKNILKMDVIDKLP